MVHLSSLSKILQPGFLPVNLLIIIYLCVLWEWWWLLLQQKCNTYFMNCLSFLSHSADQSNLSRDKRQKISQHWLEDKCKSDVRQLTVDIFDQVKILAVSSQPNFGPQMSHHQLSPCQSGGEDSSSFDAKYWSRNICQEPNQIMQNVTPQAFWKALQGWFYMKTAKFFIGLWPNILFRHFLKFQPIEIGNV